MCQCIMSEDVCGSDGVTYVNFCQLRRVKPEITVEHRGRCETSELSNQPHRCRTIINTCIVLIVCVYAELLVKRLSCYATCISRLVRQVHVFYILRLSIGDVLLSGFLIRLLEYGGILNPQSSRDIS